MAQKAIRTMGKVTIHPNSLIRVCPPLRGSDPNDGEAVTIHPNSLSREELREIYRDMGKRARKGHRGAVCRIALRRYEHEGQPRLVRENLAVL